MIDKQNQQISDLEGEVSLLRRRMQQVDDARIKKEGEIQKLKQEIDRLRLVRAQIFCQFAFFTLSDAH